MAKYNIYKINKPKETALLSKLEAVGLSLSVQKSIDDYTLSLYLSKKPEDIDIWWVDLYKGYIDSEIKLTNKAYFAVFLISSPSLLYAISMGKSHFYLKDYCDLDFGINLAERITANDLKLKNSKLFGGKKSKTIISYQENSEFEYDSGESINYVKAKTIDKDKWGEVASFGNSVQLHLDLTPDDLIGVVTQIEEELQKEPKINLPRAAVVTDEAKIAELDEKLAQEILNTTNAGLQSAEASVSGVDFIFRDKSQYRFLFERHKQDIQGELNLAALRDFVNQNSINLAVNINSIRIKASDEYNKGYTKPLKYFLDFVDDERHFLLDGKWQIFNQNYIAFLQKQIDDRITLETPNIHYSSADFEQWRNSLSGEDKTQHGYAEYYFNSVREKEGYTNLDRNISMLMEQYKIEKMDLYKDGTAFFVKMGVPQKLGYAIDQSIGTVKILQSLTASIVIDGQEIRPKRICLWFIFDRQRQIARISEIKSLLFLIKLSEWQRQCSNAGFDPVVRVGYKR